MGDENSPSTAGLPKFITARVSLLSFEVFCGESEIQQKTRVITTEPTG